MNLEERNIKKIKEDLRRIAWMTLDKRGVAEWPLPVYGRIPNFKGSRDTAQVIAEMDVFKKASVIAVSPDSPQTYIRKYALLENKKVVVPSPRLREGFVLLDPSKINRSLIGEAASIRGFMKYGEKVDPWDLPKIDLFIAGSVAVNLKGARLGKGGGFSDLEYAILRTFNKVSEDTPVLTNVHEYQILYFDIPMEKHDVPVDIIVTPNNIYYTEKIYPKPQGIYWDILRVEGETKFFIDKIRKYLKV
ncbi:MAG: 5-formyltetrahydrofolate cyclo-ligase [Sulfolobales archaeon]